MSSRGSLAGLAWRMAWVVCGCIISFTSTQTPSYDAPSTKKELKTTASQPITSHKNISSTEECRQAYIEKFDEGVKFCKAVYDSYSCWPPILAGATVYLHCPPARMSDTSRLAFRRCGEEGLWLGRKKNESSEIGWTNYTPCFNYEIQHLIEKVYSETANPQITFKIAENTRIMEIIGFSLSLVALLVSQFIFYYFRCLRNFRTLIHRNLFLAMTLQVIVRLILYLDQVFFRDNSDSDTGLSGGLDSMPYLCEACYVALEYAVSAMFSWMLLEGLFLNSLVTANALRETISYRFYLLIGWGAPAVVTLVWAAVTGMHYSDNRVQQCWYGYNFLPEYWVSQGPRVAVIAVNMGFLLNILRVVISKLNSGRDSELEKARKATRAALVLLPLLGITNILNMIEPPLDGSSWKFAAWSYTTHFLRSFQGLILAISYCLSNIEVRRIVKKSYTDWRSLRSDTQRMRQSSRNFNKSQRRRMYSNPQVLDNLETFRCDEETNFTDGD